MQDMRKDAELLNTLLDESPVAVDRRTGHNVIITAKTLGHWTDRSIQTISDYRVGKTNVPIDFWRQILAHHLDVRIVALLMPDNLDIECYDLTASGPVGGAAFFKAAVESEGEHHEKQKYIAEMLADGRIDELDESSVQAYDDAYLRHRQADAQLHRAIIAKYNRAVSMKGAR